MNNEPGEALKACPFCGRKAIIEDFHDGDDPQPLFVATCEVCPVKTYDQFSAREAANIWNSRAPLAAVEGDALSLIVDLQRELAYFFGQYHGGTNHRNDVLRCMENECVRIRKLLAAAVSSAPAKPPQPQTYHEGFDDAARVSRVLNQVTAPAQPEGEQKLITREEWASLSAESRFKINAYFATPSETPDILWINPTAGAVANYQAGEAFLPYRRVVAEPPPSSTTGAVCTNCGGSGEIEIGCAMDHALTAPCVECGGTGRAAPVQAAGDGEGENNAR